MLKCTLKISNQQKKHRENMIRFMIKVSNFDIFDFPRNYSINKLPENYNEYFLQLIVQFLYHTVEGSTIEIIHHLILKVV